MEVITVTPTGRNYGCSSIERLQIDPNYQLVHPLNRFQAPNDALPSKAMSTGNRWQD